MPFVLSGLLKDRKSPAIRRPRKGSPFVLLSAGLGAFFAGIAGGLWAHLITAITPGSFSLIMAFNIVVMVVVGGMGSITGSFLAAILFSTVTEFFRPIEEHFEMYGIGEIFMAFILILILIYRPKGIFGSVEPKILLDKERAV